METDKIQERFNLIAQKYDQQRRHFIPCFDDFYQTSIGFLAEVKPNCQTILELGAGTGLLTQYLFNKFPQAQFTLLDISGQMMEVAKERFAGLSNFHYVVADYSEQLPGRKWNLVASALSIHHLDEDEKAALFSRIYNRLPENGCFINLDIFNASTQLMNEHYNKWWYNYINQDETLRNEQHLWIKRRELDKENTIPETLEMLKQVGFKHVECVYNFMKFGVVIAIK
ncbi:MAG TPA: L-histidine N(alpha)-methyltransferase [Bacteroidales bacterium]|nr:L-histidine N(alpha)-methyltransferase [Bacteroidales bacterium]